MHAETPLVACLLRELQGREMLGLPPGLKYPDIRPESETLHAVFYLLQEIGGLPVKFRFKGAVSPYSNDLAAIFSEYNADREFWGRQADRCTLSEASVTAVNRVAQVGRDVPSAFIHSPPDYERWWLALATYLFVSRSPLYASGARETPLEDLRRRLPEFLGEKELQAAADKAEALA
jgi:hypothetical protein